MTQKTFGGILLPPLFHLVCQLTLIKEDSIDFPDTYVPGCILLGGIVGAIIASSKGSAKAA